MSVQDELRHLADAAALGRRGFLKLTGATGAGLLLAAALPAGAADSDKLVASAELNAFVRVGTDGRIDHTSAAGS